MMLRRSMLYALASLGALLLILTLTPVVRFAVEATEPDWDDGGGEVLVVLGGSMLVPGAGPQATLGYDTYLRCIYASWVLKTRTFRSVVVTGGEGLAQGMQKLLVENGVDSHVILTERSAASTYENATFTRRILAAQFPGKPLPPVVVLTSDYHARRARLTFVHSGFRAQTIPVPDLIKQTSFPGLRLAAAQTLVLEWVKDFFYFASGKA